MTARIGLMLAACILLRAGGVGRAADQADPAGDQAASCAAAGNDDTLRPYTPALDAGLRRAFRTLFHTSREPSAAQLAAQTHVRCMGGRLYACFTGANLPCGRINTSRRNAGADAYCRTRPEADVVPAFAAGHDSLYTWHCRAGQAEVSGRVFGTLDPRGFASRLWAPVD